MLERLLSKNVLLRLNNIPSITEIRLRLNKPMWVYYGDKAIKTDYIVKKEDIDYTVAVASHNSIYAVQDMLIKGYLSCNGGIRIGLSGEGVQEHGKLVTIKNISSLTVRLPHSIFGCADNLKFIVDDFKNTLLISPPGAGKTTLLRELVRLISNKGNNVLLIDERSEISASVDGINMLDVGGQTDILINIPKLACYESAVRTMSPNIVATDEIFGQEEVNCILDCVRCGVKVLATVHGDSVDGVLKSKAYSCLKDIICNYIVLSKLPKVGSVKEVIKT